MRFPIDYAHITYHFARYYRRLKIAIFSTVCSLQTHRGGKPSNINVYIA